MCDLQQAQGASAGSEVTPEEKEAHFTSKHQQQQHAVDFIRCVQYGWVW